MSDTETDEGAGDGTGLPARADGGARRRVEDARRLEAGDQVGHYTIVDRVGRGGFGVVYKAHDGERTYAVKFSDILWDEKTADDEARVARERAARECSALLSLSHPGIVQVHSFGWWPHSHWGWPYIAMDFVDGYEVHRWRKERGATLRQICAVFAGVSDALEHMHSAKILHRDVKAENILVRAADDHPVLIDLGIARAASRKTAMAEPHSIGTESHFSPEYCRWFQSEASWEDAAEFPWSPLTDLYALGVVLYEVLTGRPPILLDGYTPGGGEVLSAIIEDEPPVASEVNTGIPAALSAIVMRVLDKAPEQRQESAGALRDELQALAVLPDPVYDQAFDVPDRATAAASGNIRKTPGGTRRVRAATGVFVPSGHLPSAALSRSVARAATALSPRGAAAAARPNSAAARAAPAGAFEDPGLPPTQAIVESSVQERPAPTSREQPHHPSAIRKAQQFIGQPGEKRGGSNRILLLVGAGLAVVVLFLMAHSGGGASRDHLLQKLQTEQAAAADAGSTAAPDDEGGPISPFSPPLAASRKLPAAAGGAVGANGTPDAVGAPGTPGAPGASGAPAVSAPVPGAGGRGDARDIDAKINERFGRPNVLPGAGGPPAPAGAPGTTPVPPPEPSPVARSAALDPLPALKGDGHLPPLGIPMGTHIRAKLVSNLDSRTIAGGPVEATLPVPFVLKGEVVLPARTMLYGHASDSGGRFRIDFTQMRLPDDREYAFEALAFDRGDNKPGLAAAETIAPAQSSGGQEGLGLQIARGTGGVLLSQVTGGVVQDVARGAGSAVVTHREDGSKGGGGQAILLDGGAVFDVWISKGF